MRQPGELVTSSHSPTMACASFHASHYTERMFGYGEAFHNRLGSRRLGGPVQFKDLWPGLREDLHEAYLANGAPGGRDVEGFPGTVAVSRRLLRG
jgi:hypothetical protein